MRFLLFLCAILGISSCTKEQENPQIPVPVKLVKEITHPFLIDSILNAKKTTFLYDDQHQLIRKNNHDENDSVISYGLYTYSKDTITTHFYRNQKLDAYSISYRYFSRIRKKEQFGKTENKPGVPANSITYLGHTLTYFDECNRLTRKEEYDFSQMLLRYQTIVHAADDRSLVWKEFSADNTLLLKREISKTEIVSEFNNTNNARCFDRSNAYINTYDYRSNSLGDLNQFAFEYEIDSDNYPIRATLTNTTNGLSYTSTISYY